MADRLLRRKNLKYKRKIIGAGLNHTSINGFLKQYATTMRHCVNRKYNIECWIINIFLSAPYSWQILIITFDFAYFLK